MATWLVTGGCGFIGSHLVEALLTSGDRVRVLDDLSSGKRDNIPGDAELRVGDVADPSAVSNAMEGVSGCFHLAAVAAVQRCNEDWVASHRTNLTGTVTILERASRSRGAAIPVVYASSAAVYGDSPALPLKETAVAKPLSAYGVDKLACELHAAVGWSIHRVPSLGLRFFNVYGPRQDPKSPYSGVISIFAARAAQGLTIEVYGDGKQIRDFIYVADVVKHLCTAMKQLNSGARVLNVCTGRATSVLALASLISKLSGHECPIQHRPARPGDIRASLGDPAGAIAILGLSAGTTLADGLARTLPG
jgi:UDP-glucose 4-epimerase